jgi:hypothetical protein
LAPQKDGDVVSKTSLSGSIKTVLLSEIVDHVLLLGVDPASQDKQ